MIRPINADIKSGASTTFLEYKQTFRSDTTSAINLLTRDKNLDLSKFKAYAGDRKIITKKLKFPSGMVENIVGKLVTIIFSFFSQCFQNFPFQAS